MRGELFWDAVDAYDSASRTVDNVYRVHDTARAVGRGARGAYRGSRGLHARAIESRHTAANSGAGWQRGPIDIRARPGMTMVSGEIFHGDGDRERALAQLSIEWAGFAADVVIALRDPNAPTSLREWAKVNLAPVLHEWALFQHNEGASWTMRFSTNWSAFVEWQERLKRLRELARVQGVPLNSPEPARLPTTIWEQGDQGTGGKAAVLWGALKTIVLAGIAITGAVTLYTVARDIKGKRDERRELEAYLAGVKDDQNVGTITSERGEPAAGERSHVEQQAQEKHVQLSPETSR